MKKSCKNILQRILFAFTFTGMLFLSSNSVFAQGATSEVVLHEIEPTQNINELVAEQNSSNLRARRAFGSWFDNGQGPGQLPYQGRWYYSDILSGYGSGYMTNINYSWQGNFNGWNNVKVYLFIVNTSGYIVAYADVTNSSSSNLSVPTNTYPATYDIAFGYIVDVPLEVAIYQGPTFGWVNSTVQYQ